MKTAMITFLKNFNKTASPERIITRLHYIDNGKSEYVEDFSPFASNKYMSSELLEALTNRQTLSARLEKELSCFVVEGYYA